MTLPNYEDIRGPYRAPEDLQQFLAHRYGLNPFGSPLFRLVWTQSRFNLEGGMWIDWHEADSQRDRNDAVTKPWRRVGEMRRVPAYPEGVAHLSIERWMPAEHYGMEETWYSPIQDGGTMLMVQDGWIPTLGPYPARGAYEDVGATIKPPLVPSRRLLVKAIAYADRVRRKGGATPLARAWRRAHELNERTGAEAKQRRQLNHDMIEDLSVKFSPSVGYGGTARSPLADVCDRLGISSHHF